MTDACKQVFEKIKTKKDYRYVVFYIKDEKFIDVESTGMWCASVCALPICNLVLFILSQVIASRATSHFWTNWRSSAPTVRRSAVTVSLTLNTLISVRELKRCVSIYQVTCIYGYLIVFHHRARKRNFSSCHGALMMPKLRRRCCIHHPLMLWRRHWLVLPSTSR